MKHIEKIVRLIIYACLLLGAVATAAEQEAPSESVSALLDMPAEKFFALEKTGNSIDPDRLDQAVLTAAILHETNRRRYQAGRKRLDHHSKLDEAARRHAVSMTEKDYISHTNPYDPEHRSPQDRAVRAGFEPAFIAENIATHFGIRYQPGKKVYGLPAPQDNGLSYQPDGPPIPMHTYGSFAASLLDQWMNSPEHRRNILAEHPEFFGAGCSVQPENLGMHRFYCVHLFGTPATALSAQ